MMIFILLRVNPVTFFKIELYFTSFVAPVDESNSRPAQKSSWTCSTSLLLLKFGAVERT